MTDSLINELFLLLKDQTAEVRAAYDRLHKYFFAYVVGVLIVIGLCWCLNVLGFKEIIHMVILIAVPASLVVLTRQPVVLPLIKYGTAWFLLAGTFTDTEADTIVSMIEKFIKLICVVTYAAIWPLLLLASWSFEYAPSAFWTLMIGVATLIATELFYKLEKKRVVDFFLDVTPIKLVIQFLLSLLKLSIWLA